MTMPTTPGRIVTQNSDRHPQAAARTPPSAGPSAMPTPNVPDHRPIARARTAGLVNVVVMMPIAIGVSADPAAPCSARQAISQPTFGATLQPNDATVNITSPACSTVRRPNRSPMDPEVSIRLAAVIAYAAIVHCSPATGACRPRPISGSARLTTVVSTAIMNMLRQQMNTVAASTVRLAGRPATRAVIGAVMVRMNQVR
jgi:hypothetical protein